MSLYLGPIAVLAAASVFAQQPAIPLYIPAGTVPVTQISSCAGVSPTVCTTITDHGLAAGDVVLVYMIVEHAGSVNQMSAMNAPPGSARKVGAAGLTHNTLTFTDLSGNPVNTANTVLANSGFVRKAAPSTLNLGPRVGLDGTGGPVQMGVSATIMDGTLANIAVAGSLATVNYQYPHGLSGSGNQIQVRNASLAALNGIHAVTVTSPTAVTYTIAASTANGIYTDTNLGVSSRAIDGQPAWEKIKWYSTYADSGHVDFIYQSSQAQPSFGNCAAAAYYWYVDRSRTAMRDFAVGCINRFEDFYPGPEFCREDLGPFCPVGNGNSRAQASDFVRIQVTNAATLYTLMRPQLTSAQKTVFRNFFLNDTPDHCTRPAWVQGPGTMSSSGTAVNGVSTTFTRSFHTGDYIFAWDSTIAEEIARVVAIADDTHMVVTSNFPAFASGTPYWVVPAFLSPGAGGGAACGVLNFYSHHIASTATRDARLYVQPAPAGTVEATGYLPAEGDWITSQGNNQEVTATFASISLASAMAEDDPRALNLLQELGAWDYDYLGSEIVGTWGGLLQSGPYYGLGRTVLWDLGTLKIGQRSVANFPDITAPPHNNGPKAQLYQYLYSHLPESAPNDPWFSPWSYLGGELTLSTQFSSLATLGSIAGGSEGQYMRYFLSHHATSWENGGSWLTEAPLLMALLDPNAPAEADYTTLPLQIQLAATDASYCGSLGLTCANGSPSFVQPNMVRAAIVSRTSWTGSATIFSQTNLGGEGDTAGNPEDHGATIPGNYHLIKASTPGLGGCLIGDNDNSCVFGNGPGYGTGELTATTSLAAGTALTRSNGVVNALFGPVLHRWSGNDQFGDPSSRYAGSTWELASYYAPGEGVSRAQRSYAHFKKPGTDEFVLIYDDVAKSAGTIIAGYTQYPQGAPAGCCSHGTTTFSGGLLATTNPDNFRILTRWLAPAGASSLAVTNDGTSHPGNQGDTMAYRVTHCASMNGTTCNPAAAGMEAIQAHYVTTSAQSGFAITLLSPDSNWTGALVAGATDAKIALWARHGTLQSSMTGFTPSYAGTAQILISGLAPGAYTVTVGGSPVAGSPFTVNAGDNSLYFEAAAGAIQINGAGGGAGGGNPGGAPAWAITATHSGNFFQGQTGAVYTITVANNGTAATSGTVTVADTLPAGLTATAMSGTGWSCTVPACTRGDVLAAGASYPPVTLMVNVASNAPSLVTNQASVWGCGAAAAGASDPTTVAAGGGSGWAINGGIWARRKAITITHTQVSGPATLVDFPMLVSSTDPDFRTTASGGSVGRADGKDIFFTDGNGVKLNHELESYDGVAGKIIAWVEVPSISPSADTPLYVYFGNAASGDQQNIAGTWDANYRGVWHFGNPSTLSLADSSANGNTLTNHSATAAAGPIDGGITLNGAGEYVSTNLDGTAWSQFTVEYWVYPAGTPVGPLGQFQWAVPATPISGLAFLLVAHNSDNNLRLYFDGDYRAAYPLTDLLWHHVVVTWDPSRLVTLYVDGLNRGSYTSAASPVYQPNANVVYFGTGYYGTYNGKEGEARVSSAVRSADWIRTEYNSQNSPASFYGLGASQSGLSGGAPDLAITATHSGNFTQGQAGAAYRITVVNSGTAATSGTVTVADAVPAGLTVTAISGTGWSCTLSTASCNRWDALAAGASYPPITVSVNVAANAPAAVVNTATVAGGGETNGANDTANDPTTINSAGAPAWRLSATHDGSFVQGQVSAVYTINLANNGTAPTNGTVTVTDTLPTSLTPTAMSGTGWTCTRVSCTRSDTLAAGGGYPPITVTVNVASNSPSQVINQVTVAGGGAAAASASDPTAVTANGGSGWSINGGTWAKRKPITVAHTQVSGSSPLANFPMLFSSTDADFRTSANGGAVGRADGQDIFFADANGIKLNHELQSYNGAAGKVIAWVEVPALSPGADTLIYVYFGNAESGDQQNVAGTWDTSYKGVWHLGNRSALSVGDSSSNQNHLINHSVTEAAGPIDGGMSLGGNDQYVFANLDGTAWPQFTVEYWVYSAGTPSYEEGQFQWAPANTPIAGEAFLLLQQNSANNLRLYFDGDYRVAYPLANFTWHHVAATWNSSHVATLYVDGIGRGSYTSSAATVYEPLANVVYYGTGYYATYTGTEGECRVSNSARSADWVRTEYNNQSAPGVFYRLGSSQ